MLKDCPYRGLVPYGEQDARYFFGRNWERRLISAALRASRLTVLYGESGAGKSSVLAAGVAHDLRDDPDYALVLFRNWRDEPVAGLLNTVRDRLSKLPGFSPNREDRKLGDLLERWSESTNRGQLIVLDQFEEYFQYHPGESGSGKLVEELPRLVNQPNLPVNLLIAVREDALGTLDRFKGAIPGLFDNLVRIDHLTVKAARDAIWGPLAMFNALPEHAGATMKMDEELPAKVIKEILSAQESAGGGSKGEPRVQAAYLQLVMTQWWEREVEEGSRMMREQTLSVTLGGVKKVVEGHLKSTIEKLAQSEREAADFLFREMVTSTGRKIAKTVKELEDSTPLDRAGLGDLLAKLSDARLLSTVPPPRGAQPGERCYEFAHDEIARAAFEWRKQFRQAQQLAEARKKEQEANRRAEEQARQAKRLSRLALLLAGIILLAGVLSVVAWHQTKRAKEQGQLSSARELEAAAVANLDADPELSLLLTLQSIRKTVTPEVEDFLLRAIAASRVRLTLRGHADELHGIALSRDGTRLATASQDGTAKVWDFASGRELFTLCDHTGSVDGVAFAPDGARLATASKDGTAKVWDFASGRELLTLRGHTGAVDGVAFSADGKWLATASIDGTARIWDAASGREVRILRGHAGWVDGVVFSADGKWLATASLDQTAKIWDVASGRLLITLRGPSPVFGVDFSPDGTLLATASWDGNAKVWNATSGRELLGLVPGYVGSVMRVRFSPGGTRLATASFYGTVEVWDVACSVRSSSHCSGHALLTLRGHSGPVAGVVFNPTGDRLATASYDKTAKVWDLGSGLESLALRGHEGQVEAVVFSPDGKRLASAGHDGTTKVWDWATSKVLLTLRGHASPVMGVAFSPLGSRLATANSDGTAEVWDAATGQKLLTLTGHKGAVSGVAFSSDGERLATSGVDGTARVWGARSGEDLLTFNDANGNAVNAVAFSPDGKHLATAGSDYTAKVWELASHREPLTLRGHTLDVLGLSFSPHGERLATASADGTAKVWDWALGRVLYTLPGHTSYVFGVAFSPDGRRLATAGRDGTIKLWDAAAGGESLTLGGHSGAALGIAFSPDGGRLATASEDGSVEVYTLKMKMEEMRNLARTRLTRNLTPDECQRYLHTASCPEEQ